MLKKARAGKIALGEYIFALCAAAAQQPAVEDLNSTESILTAD